MKKILFIVIAAAAMAACSQKAVKTTLIGTFPPEMNESVLLNVQEMDIDTTLLIKDGRVEIDLPVNKAAIGVLSPKNGQALQFILDGTDITADFTVSPPAIIAADGSLNDRMNKISLWGKEANDEYGKQMMNIEADSTMSDSDKEEAFEARRNEAVKEYTEKYKECMEENKDNYLGLYAFSMLQNILDSSECLELFEKLEGEAKESGLYKELKQKFDKKESTGEGKMFTDFAIEQTPGDTVRLSDYVGRGKYVLVDFWASWCGPCRREIPNIKAVYDKYHGDSFEVLSVAVWDKPDDTKKALDEEGLKWPQIVNAQQIPTDIYGIEGIPHIILFGPDGTILKRDLRGDNIEAEVSKYVMPN